MQVLELKGYSIFYPPSSVLLATQSPNPSEAEFQALTTQQSTSDHHSLGTMDFSEHAYQNSFGYNDTQYYVGGDDYLPPVDHVGSFLTRFLAPSGGETYLDYSVFSVVICTLCLVLVVEILRHTLDVAASGNPFFQKVLELMYQELSTLGIVEFVLYLMHKYWEAFNYELEAVFVDVHFLLFYTSVFNALQSVLVRVISTRRTDKSWVQTEEIDRHHYIAIRNELERVENEIRRLKQKSHGGEQQPSPEANDPNQQSSTSMRKLVQDSFDDFVTKIRYPYLSSRRSRLILPVRYHELRLHFTISNNLPPGYRVSHYLKRSLTEVLLDFIHISSTSWIMLMASANLLYFLSGTILYYSANNPTVTKFLIGIFLSMCCLFIIAASALYFKMRAVFSEILHMKLTVDDAKANETAWKGYTVLQGDAKTKDQLKLFWGGNPHFIIIALQYMQFGYALGLAFLFTYWKQIKLKDYLGVQWLFIILLLSYAIFSFFTAEILPWYTLTTSMGQLVNEERVNETLAKLKLSEEIRKKEAIEEEKKIQREIEERQRKLRARNAMSILENVTERFTDTVSERVADLQHSGSFRFGRKRSSSDGVRSMRSLGDVDKSSNQNSLPKKHERKKSLSDGVNFMTGSQLSETLSSSVTRFDFKGGTRLSSAASEELNSVDGETEQKDISIEADHMEIGVVGKNEPINSNYDSPVGVTKERRRLKKSHSENVAVMRASLFNEPMSSLPNSQLPAARESRIGSSLEKLNELVQMPVKDLPNITPYNVNAELEQPKDEDSEQTPTSQQSLSRNGRKDRRRRMKAHSEGVSMMRSSLLNDGTRKPALSPVKENNIGAKPETQKEAADEEPSMARHPVPRFGGIERDPVSQDDSSRPIALSDRRNDRKNRRRRMKAQSEGVSVMRTSLFNGESRVSKGSLFSVKETDAGSNLETLNELVQMPAKDLPEIKPYGQQVKGEPPKDNFSLKSPQLQQPLWKITDRKDRRRRMKACSEGVSMMRSSLLNEGENISISAPRKSDVGSNIERLDQLVQMPAKELPEIPAYNELAVRERKMQTKKLSDEVSCLRVQSSVAKPEGLSLNNGHDSTKTSTAEKSQESEVGSSITSRNNNLQVGASQSAQQLVPMNEVNKSVNFSLPEHKVPSFNTIDSAASVDGDSDVDDIPEAHLSPDLYVEDKNALRSFIEKIDLAKFFQGSKYRTVSLLLGPMICFFVVAMRIEGFNIEEYNLYDQKNTFHFNLPTSFWIEVAWYCGMIVEFLVVLTVFFTRKSHAGEFLFSFIAATCGLLINVLCLSLLLIAESKRCCDESLNSDYFRFLAEDYYESEYKEAKDDGNCCPGFGQRTYGGLGSIEPFTSLIALSPFRFAFAGYILRILGEEASDHEHHDIHSHHEEHGHHGPDPVSKARELWIAAIGSNSLVAKRYGIFSGEFLQCMLGIGLFDKDSENDQVVKPVNFEGSEDDFPNEERLNGSSFNGRGGSSESGLNALSERTSLTPNPDDLWPTLNNSMYNEFSYPEARLIRSMRRCETLLLPLLDEWMLCDVVLTSHELVLLDVCSSTNVSSEENAPSENVVSSNGGKGLKLCEITKNRKVVSIYDIDDIDFVSIERRHAIDGNAQSEDVENDGGYHLEFWQGGGNYEFDYNFSAINSRWFHVDEDRLKIHVTNGTLYMRFMVDLIDKEREIKGLKENQTEAINGGLGSNLWCRSIARLRGAGCLKQDLPHYGQDGVDELGDFIEICERESDDNQNNRKQKRQTMMHRLGPDRVLNRQQSLRRKTFHG